MAPALPIDRSGDFGKVAVFWAALRQASARHCACICGTKIKAQVSVENLICTGFEIEAQLGALDHSLLRPDLSLVTRLNFVGDGEHAPRNVSSGGICALSKKSGRQWPASRQPGRELWV